MSMCKLRRIGRPLPACLLDLNWRHWFVIIRKSQTSSLKWYKRADVFPREKSKELQLIPLGISVLKTLVTSLWTNGHLCWRRVFGLPIEQALHIVCKNILEKLLFGSRFISRSTASYILQRKNKVWAEHNFCFTILFW